MTGKYNNHRHFQFFLVCVKSFIFIQLYTTRIGHDSCWVLSQGRVPVPGQQSMRRPTVKVGRPFLLLLNIPEGKVNQRETTKEETKETDTFSGGG